MSTTIDLLEGDILFRGDTGIVLGRDYFGIKEESMTEMVFEISEILHYKFNEECYTNMTTNFGGYTIVLMG